MATQATVRDTGGEEMAVVEEGEAHAGGGDDPRQVGIPDALGEPDALRLLTEVAPAEALHEVDLAARVVVREHREQRFVEAAAEHLHLAAFGERVQIAQEGGTICLKPLEQRPAVVEGGLDPRELGEGVQEGAVAAVVGLGEDVIEVAHRLVIVNRKDESELGHGCVPHSSAGMPA